MKSVYMQGFSTEGVYDRDLCYNGKDFNINKLFMLISNHGMSKHEKVYFEFTISEYIPNTSYKHLPIYVGVHKEPTSGTLSNDFCLGCLAYKKDDDKYTIMEKINRTGDTKIYNPNSVYTRTPGLNDIIGVAIDIDNNLISIYNNGKLFYTIQPSLFNMATDNDMFYPCIYSAISCNYYGSVNQGKYGVTYLPNGYRTVFTEHNKTQLINDIDCKINIEYKDNVVLSECEATITFDPIKGDGSLKLLSSTEYTEPDGVSFILLNDSGYLYSNLPIAKNYHTYTELYVRNGVQKEGIYGIPISIGLTSMPDSLEIGNTIRIPLYHKQYNCYEYFQTSNLTTQKYVIDDVFTSVANEEGKYIGIGYDPSNKTINIWINKILFYSYKITDFDPSIGEYYIFIKDDGVFTNDSVIGEINFGVNDGEIPFFMDMPESYVTLWHYYNRMVLTKLENPPIIESILYVDTTPVVKRKSIKCKVDVEYADDDMRANYHNGINKMMDTYNTVFDTKDHWTDSSYQSMEYLNNLIKNNNKGYSPDDSNYNLYPTV